jgi:hypothetical protein
LFEVNQVIAKKQAEHATTIEQIKAKTTQIDELKTMKEDVFQRLLALFPNDSNASLQGKLLEISKYLSITQSLLTLSRHCRQRTIPTTNHQ